MRRSLFYVIAGSVMAVPTVATAQPADFSPMFSSPALSDAALSDIRGTASPFAPFSRGSFARIADVQARNDFRQYGSVARIQMDVWWGTIGSELIANATRAAP